MNPLATCQMASPSQSPKPKSTSTPARPNASTLDVRISTMDAVLDVVTTLGRVGASIVTLRAELGRVEVTFVANDLVTRRLPSLMQTIVPVTDVTIVESGR